MKPASDEGAPKVAIFQRAFCWSPRRISLSTDLPFPGYFNFIFQDTIVTQQSASYKTVCGQKSHLLQEDRPTDISLLPPTLQKGFTALPLPRHFLRGFMPGSKLSTEANRLATAQFYLSKCSDPQKLGSCLQTICGKRSLNSAWSLGPCQLLWAGATERTSLCGRTCPSSWKHSQAQLVLPHHLQQYFFSFLKPQCPLTAHCSTLDLPKSGSFNSLMSSLLLVRRQVPRCTKNSPTNNFPAVSSTSRSYSDNTFSIVFRAVCFASNGLLAKLNVEITHANSGFPAMDRNMYGELIPSLFYHEFKLGRTFPV